MSVRRCSTDFIGRAMLAGILLFAPAAPAMAQAAPQPPALGGAARWADSARRLIDRGTITGDTGLLSRGEAVARKALTAFPGDPLLLHYVGYAIYRLAQRESDDVARKRYEDAVTLLEQSVAARPMPETWALIASAKGSMIGDSMLRGIRLGPQATEAEDKGRALDADNPRLLLLTGISAMFKPSAFGGGDDRAYERLTKAITRFEQERVTAPAPAWGHAEAWAWLGQLELKRKRPDAAKAAYERALAIEPEFAWVRFGLMPALARAGGPGR